MASAHWHAVRRNNVVNYLKIGTIRAFRLTRVQWLKLSYGLLCSRLIARINKCWLCVSFVGSIAAISTWQLIDTWPSLAWKKVNHLTESFEPFMLNFIQNKTRCGTNTITTQKQTHTQRHCFIVYFRRKNRHAPIELNGFASKCFVHICKFAVFFSWFVGSFLLNDAYPHASSHYYGDDLCTRFALVSIQFRLDNEC